MTGNVGEILDFLSKAQDIALFCHTNPDGDALGSTLALALALEKAGKQVSLYCDCAVPKKYTFLKGSEKFSLPTKTAHEAAISVDCSSLDRLGKCTKCFLLARKRAAIDHHASFERFTDTCFVDGKASACAELVFEVIKEMSMLDADIAALLFGAIVTDSGCFAFSSVTENTHIIASELMSYGIDAADIIYKVYKSTDIDRFRLKSRILQKAQFFEENSVAAIVFEAEDFAATGTSLEQTEGMINELIDIDSVQVAYALSEVAPRNFKLSIRTKSPINAAEIANCFGGGGHVNAAGCRVNGFKEDILEKIVKLAKDRL